MQHYDTELEQWVTQKKMSASSQKHFKHFFLTLRQTWNQFTHSSHLVRKTASTEQNTYNTHMTFTALPNNIITKATHKVNALRTWTGTRFEQEKDSLASSSEC